MCKREKIKKIILAVRGILYVPERGVLMLKRADGEGMIGTWEVPGGKVQEVDMYCRQALAMEFLEETGLPVNIPNVPIYVWDCPSGLDKYGPENHYTCIFFKVDLAYPETIDIIRLSKEHTDYKWVKLPEGLAELDGKGVYPETRRALDRFYQQFLEFPKRFCTNCKESAGNGC